MCGIVAVVGKAANEKLLQKMLSKQWHRGPDFTGSVVKDAKVALGHNRLSIVDLSADANQPMTDASGRYVLLFNGEIYNYIELRETLKPHYTFRTQSDSEVLLAAYHVWGEAMLERLKGMFAFIIYDREEGSLFGARDRFGVKPFFYALEKGTLYIASEIATLQAAGIGGQPNESVWASYLVGGSYGLPHETFWSGIFQLPGGYAMNHDASGLRSWPWYDFVSRVRRIRSQATLEEVQAHYTRLLERSIELRFRADVEVGFNLSGGLDSSTLLAMVDHMRSSRENIRAFTFYTGDDRYDELSWVRQMLRGRSHPLEAVRLDAKDVPDLAKEMAVVQSEPYGGIPTLAYAKLFRRARALGVKVLLDGQGMDEQWAGYDYYTRKSGSLVQGTKSAPTRPGVLHSDFAALAQKAEYPRPFVDEVRNLQYRDLFYTKIPRALRFNDRVSMAASTELREPFLDYEMVEYAFAQPLEYKIHHGERKWLLRKIASKFLDAAIVTAPKRPLQTPQREWLGHELAPFVEEQIDTIANGPASAWFDRDALYREWRAYREGDQDNAFFVWQWVSVGLMLIIKER